MDISDIENVELTYLNLSDYEDLKQAMIEAYNNLDDAYWEKTQIAKLIQLFPEGQVVVKVNNQLAGCAFSIIVDYKKYGDRHTYAQVTGDYTFDTHDPKGDVLYGIDVFIKKNLED